MLGSLRFARGGYIQGGFDNGYLSIDTLNLAIRHIGSSWTNSLTHPSMLVGAAGGLLANPQNSRWLVQEGAFTASGRTSNTAFPIPYNLPPTVYLVEGGFDSNLTLLTNSFYYYGVSAVTTGGFTSRNRECPRLANAAEGSFFWRSEGTASYS